MNSYLEFDPTLVEKIAKIPDATLNLTDTVGVEVNPIVNLLLRFGFHLTVCLIIIHFCYYRKNKSAEYYKPFVFFASAMFLLLFLLESIKIQIGLTLGLFAIFGVIRYRTETVPVREMTYLFMIIAISVINGLSLAISFLELALANTLIVGIMLFFEYQRILTNTKSKLILYEKIDLIKPEHREEMIEDLKIRTGLNIVNVELGHIDFLKDAAFVKIYYNSKNLDSNTINSIIKLKPEL